MASILAGIVAWAAQQPCEAQRSVGETMNVGAVVASGERRTFDPSKPSIEDCAKCPPCQARAWMAGVR